MELTELREQIDAIDRELVALLERRLDVSAGIGRYKLAHDLPVLDASREAEKLAAIRAMCRPETQAHIDRAFDAILAGSRAYQGQLMEQSHE